MKTRGPLGSPDPTPGVLVHDVRPRSAGLVPRGRLRRLTELLGFPSPTSSWHGCTATASAASLSALQNPIPGARPNTQGSKQSAVTFTATAGAPYISWKANAGWTICGVQATARLSNPDVDADLLTEIGYTSTAASGTTAADGRETLQVTIPKKGIGSEFQRFEGKVFAVAEIRDVTVFVRRGGAS